MRLVANWHDPFTFFLPSSSLQFFDAVSWATLIIFAYWLTRVVPEKGPLDGCVCVCLVVAIVIVKYFAVANFACRK